MFSHYFNLFFSRIRNSPATFASLTTVGLFGASLILRLGSNLVLSRLVIPDVFGLMALVTIAIIGLVLLSDVGLAPAVVHHEKGDDPDFLRTAWTAQAARGVLIWGACWIAAPAVAWFYGEPMLTILIPIVGMSVAIEGFSSTGVMTAQRRLKPTAMISYNVLSQLLGTIITCTIAWFYPNIWALVIGTLAGSLLRAISSYLLPSVIKHRFRWHREYAWELFHFGKWIFVCTAAGFFAMQIDRIVLGKLGSLEVLGLYSIAATIAILPVNLITHIGDYVLFPLLAKMARETRETLRLELAPARGRILGFGLILNTGVFATAPLLFDHLYGAEYQSAGALCQWLVLSTWIGILVTVSVQTLKAVGDVQSMAFGKILRFLATIPLSIAGFHYYGLEGFIAGFTLGCVPEHALIAWQLWKQGLFLPVQEIGYTLASIASVIAIYYFGTSFWAIAALVVLISALTLFAVYHSEGRGKREVATAS
ncbi:Teichuronic acid biosynthesis protein TuaB [Planctomycetes bacterium CA13]|uniref:Teichuronic acid biosynthesis protein TuaB n=1 Tax=Novipirellula herctigrandis TaxID=2527986 RepID=A0A5C5Z5R8_9BACT|nr:Teichuronic acid biosynthesis protein TuaB [Planctomycetes bacterium CA13]